MINTKQEAKMQNNHEPNRGSNFTISLFLICLGVILLLNNLGLTAGIDWDSVVPYWPFLLILLGSENLLSGTPWGKALSFAIAMAVAIGIVFVVMQYRVI